MKNILLIIFFNIACLAKAQSIEKLIAQTEKDLSVYERLTPWGDGYLVKDFDFTEDELHYDDGSEVTKNDTIDQFDVISIFQARILTNINKIAHHKDFPKKGSEFFMVSPDNKLFNFVLYENAGGSYKSNISVIYYKENGSILYKEGYDENSRRYQSNFFNTDGYDQIDTIQTKSGVKYLLQGGVIGCNTCLSQYMKLLHFENGEPVSDFEYELRSRFGSVEQFDYEAKTKTITIEYEEDDQNNDEYDYEKGCGDYHLEVYRFNGETFESIETHWKKCIKDRIKDAEN